MKLTQKLLGALNRVFNKDPARILALQIAYQGGMTWSVQDGILTTTVSGGQGVNLTLDLSTFTIGSLVNFLAAQPGYSTPYMDRTGSSALSALILLDGTGDVSHPGGGNLYAYTSVLYAYLEANAAELELARTQIEAMPLELSTTTADTVWLDTLGTYYKVPRLANEADAAYGPRIIAQVLRPMGNNVAMEMAISVFTGQSTTVTDVVLQGVTGPVYNGANEHNSAIEHNAVSTPVYGLFDVTYGYDLLNGSDVTSFAATVVSLINTLRDAGTHLRALSLTGSALSDSLTPPTDGADLAFSVSYTTADSLTPPTDSTSVMAASIAPFSDTLNAPTDAESITVSYAYSYSGLRSYNGVIEHLGGQVITENL